MGTNDDPKPEIRKHQHMAHALEEDRHAICEEFPRTPRIPPTSVVLHCFTGEQNKTRLHIAPTFLK